MNTVFKIKKVSFKESIGGYNVPKNTHLKYFLCSFVFAKKDLVFESAYIHQKVTLT